jgi:hypothetical protein
MLLILSNILLTPQTISWAKKSNQLLVSFKLDFCKAYDRVRPTIEWIERFCSKECVWGRRGGFGILEKFVNTSKIVCVGESAQKIVNGKVYKDLINERGVRLGCPLALENVKQAKEINCGKRILLPPY